MTNDLIITTNAESSEQKPVLEPPISRNLTTKFPKGAIRSSLQASTLDGVFATLFSLVTGGVLLNNFFVELEATSLQIGMLAAIAMVANLLQPLGAFFADHTNSRRNYNLWVYGISRLFWLPLAIAICWYSSHTTYPQQMIIATLAVVLLSHVLGALGSAAWLSWIAMIVPRQLRGRYFGFRNSVFSLISLVGLPLLGLVVSQWPWGTLQGFGVMVAVGTVAGLVSLGFQFWMVDINPQDQSWVKPMPLPEKGSNSDGTAPSGAFGLDEAVSLPENASLSSVASPSQQAEILPVISEASPETAQNSILKNFQFLLFLLYFGMWAFGVNLSNPFFNLYLLDDLSINLSWVTVYNGLGAGSNLLMLLLWGKLADQIGNRPILLLNGILVALIPLLWLGTDTGTASLWLWFPLLHLLGGGTGAAIDLCINNLQLAIAPIQNHTQFFALTAAIGGISGALGALVGGWFVEGTDTGGITGLFVLSAVLRLVALLPLFWVQEPQSRSLKETLKRSSLMFRSITSAI